MAQGFIDTIGVVSGTFGIVSFFQSLFSEPDASTGAVVTFGLGIGNNPTDQDAIVGQIRAVYGYDGNNQYLGVSDLDFDLNYNDDPSLVIHQDGKQNVEAQFVNVIAGEDDICLTYIAVTEPNGDQQTWYGDIGAKCGQHTTFYPGQDVSGSLPDGSDFRPTCVWLDNGAEDDGVRDDGALATQLKIAIYEYFVEQDVTIDPGLDYCQFTVFGDGVETNPGTVPPSKRSKGYKRRTAGHDKTLVVSSVTADSHSAEALCAHERSRGPDFISLPEQMYCDMLSKTLYPLCSDTITSDCFDLEGKELNSRAVYGPNLLPRAVQSARNFTHVEYW